MPNDETLVEPKYKYGIKDLNGNNWENWAAFAVQGGATLASVGANMRVDSDGKRKANPTAYQYYLAPAGQAGPGVMTAKLPEWGGPILRSATGQEYLCINYGGGGPGGDEKAKTATKKKT